MDRFNTFKLFIQEHRNKIIIILLFIAIILLSTVFFLNIDRSVKTKTESIVFSNSNLDNNTEEIKKDLVNSDYIYVDVKGAVNSPGVYSIENGKRVVDAINLAGGLKEDASTTLLNLSIKLTDQMVIIVYSKDTEKSINEIKNEFNEQSEVCLDEIKNDACIINNPETIIIPDLVEKHDEVVSSNNNLSKININKASFEELKTLPKIGNVKANAILLYRETNGNFKSIDEIKNVKGIGDTLFESIKEYITI